MRGDLFLPFLVIDPEQFGDAFMF
jgi:hypothetical protein